MSSRDQPDDRAPPLADVTVMVNAVTAYEKVHLTLSPVELSADWPGTLLGVIPISREQLYVDLNDIRTIQLVPVVFPSRLVLVPLFAFLPVIAGLPLAMGVVSITIAVLFLLLGVVSAIDVRHPDGVTRIPVCWLQRNAVREFIASVRVAMRVQGDTHSDR